MSDLLASPRPFAGFPDRMELVSIPAAICGSLLPQIDDLGELKATLYVLRLLHEQRQAPRFVRRSHLLGDAGLQSALAGDAAAVGDALDRAEQRGVLLAVAVRDGAAPDVCYLLHTPFNLRIVTQVRAGERTLGELAPAPAPQEAPAPRTRGTIFELYEQNIGMLTPLLAEELAEAVTLYPSDWIEDAFREAVVQNKRSWRYVRRILEGWESRGRGDRGTTWRRPEAPKSPGGYLETRYGRLTSR